MDLQEKILSLADKFTEGTDFFVLTVKVNERINPLRVTVVVDGESGITIDDCAQLSRSLSGALNEAAWVEDYNLEVTTPGIDQPLRLPRQYKKHIGRSLKVELKDKETVRGRMTALDENGITLEEEKSQGKKSEKTLRQVLFSDIEKTFVMISFK